MKSSERTEIPSWARGLVDHDGLDRIREAVARVETRTSAEIVPLLVRGSSATGHVPLMLFLFLLLLAWAALPFLTIFVPECPLWIWEAVSFVFAWGVAFVLKGRLALQRWLTPRADQIASVDRRALLEFHVGDVKATEKRTGILIMASILEHRAVIIADESIDRVVPNDTWQSAIQVLLSKTREGDFAGGMVSAVEKLGEILHPRFPAGDVNPNELENGLRIKP